MRKNSISYSAGIINHIPHDGLVYCVNVPSGMILVRINGRISVVGNCDVMAMWEAGIEAVSVPQGATENKLNFLENWIFYFEGPVQESRITSSGSRIVR